jgi:poly-gamma-glutamate synthesis protein (capsule biosynthesis protein)
MKKLTLIILVCLIVVSGLVFVLGKSEKKIAPTISEELVSVKKEIISAPVEENNKPAENLYFSAETGKDFYDKAYEKVSKIIQLQELVYGGIITHHLLAAELDATFFKGLEDRNYETVILLAPNHYEEGQSDILTSKFYWQTHYGYLETDKQLIDKLVEAKVLEIDDQPFKKEHSISAVVSFIKKSLSKAKIVPIIFKFYTSSEKASRLAIELNRLVQDKTLVIASVDFSHFQPDLVAQFHDELSREVIESFAKEDIYKLEIDSPASIYTLLSYLETKGTQKSQRLVSTNSAILTNNPKITENTSYLLEYFTKGEPKEKDKITILAFGDMMLDRNVEKLMLKYDFKYPLEKIKGKEERFLKGVDVITANLEGAIADNYYQPEKAIDFRFDLQVVPILKKYNFNVFGLANNHSLDQGKIGLAQTKKYLAQNQIDYFGSQTSDNYEFSFKKDIRGQKVCLVGFNNTDKAINFQQAEANIKKLRGECQWVLAFCHWGTEYQNKFNANQQQLARKLIDWGADAVIGHHPHVVQGVEIYRQKPIFYSLGNFIFDQYFSQETQQGLAVGLVLGEKISFYLFPFTIYNSQPELMSYDESAKFYEYLIKISDIDYKTKNQSRTGKVELY